MKDRNTVDILEDIKYILTKNDDMDYRIVSLFHYLEIMETNYKQYNNLKNQYASNICCVLQIDYGFDVKVNICEMDYQNKELVMDIEIFSKVNRVRIGKNSNGQLVSRGEYSSLGYDIISMMGQVIYKLYDVMMMYESYISSKCDVININSTNFYVEVSYDRVIFYYGKNKEKSELVLEMDSSDNFKYIKVNADVVNQLRGIEDEFMKKIQIDIELVPEWSHSYLRDIRGREILENDAKKRAELWEQRKAQFLNKITSVFRKR